MRAMTANAVSRQVSLCVALLLSSCAKSAKPPVEDLSGRENLSAFALEEMRGTRDGDRLDAEAKFGDGSSTLTVTMRFAIGSPTRLESGRWQWMMGDGRLASGTVAARSVMFLGGQDGPPSVGGRFDLLDLTGAAEYRIIIPTTELKIRLRLKTDQIGIEPTQLRTRGWARRSCGSSSTRMPKRLASPGARCDPDFDFFDSVRALRPIPRNPRGCERFLARPEAVQVVRGSSVP
jgi:hypothetical protein